MRIHHLNCISVLTEGQEPVVRRVAQAVSAGLKHADGIAHATVPSLRSRTVGPRAMKYANGLLVLGGLAATDGAWACAACAPAVRARIHDADFLLNLALVISPAAVVGLLAWWLCAGDAAEGSG